MATKTNAKPEKFNPNALRWDPQHLENSLDVIFRFTVAKAEGQINWYSSRSQPKRRWAQVLRVTAILATALGGILPIVSQMPLGETAQVLFNPAWASVAIAVAATALGLDRFFGFSSAWMRFITSQLQIGARLETFQFEWMTERLAWQGRQPGYEQAQIMVAKCAAFVTEVSKIVEDETLIWVAEFQTALKKLDETAKAQAAAAESGAIRVRVSNGDACVDGWTLQVEGKSTQTHRGTSGVVSNLYPGLYRIIMKGVIADTPVQAEEVVKVDAGDVSEVSVKLA